MEKFTKQKGITLIALIITIIVMLILVAVTISVAINGGLFERAKNASEQTQAEVLREQAEAEKANAYADAVKNNEALTANGAAARIATEVGGTATGNYVTVQTKTGTYYIVVDEEDLSIEVTTDEPLGGENDIFAGKSFYSAYVNHGDLEVEKMAEFRSNKKLFLVENNLEIDYEYKDNLLNGVWPVYEINKNNVSNIAIVTTSEEYPGVYNVITNNKGANLTPLTGKTYKSNIVSEKIITFSTKDSYGIVVNGGTIDSTYYLIDNGSVCKLYFNYQEWNVTKDSNGDIISFSRTYEKEGVQQTETYELYTPEEP